jgi:alkylation response protein AidB-like acyl-CoA dehydrogenase
MRVDWTEEQEFLREAVAGVVAREAQFTTVREWAEANDVGAADALAVRQGWTGIGLDEDAGGQGGGSVELAVLAEQLGRGAVPWDRTLAGCLCAPLLAHAGADELAAATAEGDRVAVLAVDARTPVAAGDAALRVGRGDEGHATRCDDAAGDSPATQRDDAAGVAMLRGAQSSAPDVRLTLSLPHVVGAAGAHVLVVPVATDDGVELFAVAVDAPGVTVRPRTLVDRTRSLADVELDDAPTRSLGTVPAAAFRAAASAAAVIVAADALGAAARLLELTTQYVGERRQFGVAVGSFQAVKHAAAEMLVDVEAARSAVMYGAWAVDAEEPDAARHASIAKAVACAAAVRVADKALFLHGAVGYTWEHDLQFPFKRIKSDALLFGSPETHLDLIAAGLGL